MRVGLNKATIQRLSVEGFWIIVGQIATVAGALMLVRTLTGLLTPEAYGELALGLTAAGLINQMVTGSVSNGISRYWSVASEKGDQPAYIAAARHMMLLAFSAIVLVGGFLLGILLMIGLGAWLNLVVAAIALSVLSGLNGALNGLQTAARRRPVVALHSAADAWIKISLAALSVRWMGPSSAHVVWGYAASAGLVSGSQLLFLRRLLRSQPTRTTSRAQADINWIQMMWRYCWPFTGWGLFTWAQTSSDRWALQIFADTHAVGQYAALYQLGFAPMTLASTLLVSLVTPIMFQHAGDAQDPARVAKVYEATAQIALAIFILTAFVALVFGLLHGWIFELLTAPAFRGVAPLMPLMTIAAGLQACHHILGIRVSSLLKTRAILLPQIASALMFAGFNATGAYLGGVHGLAVAMVLASLGYVGWIWALSEFMRSDVRPPKASVAAG